MVYIEVTSKTCPFDSTLWFLPMLKVADRCMDYCTRGKNKHRHPPHVCGRSSPVAQRSKPCVKRSHRWRFNEWWTTGAPSGINTSRGSIFLWKTWIKLAVDDTNVIFSRSSGVLWLFEWISGPAGYHLQVRAFNYQLQNNNLLVRLVRGPKMPPSEWMVCVACDGLVSCAVCVPVCWLLT